MPWDDGFDYKPNPVGKVVFGPGRRWETASLLQDLGARKALLITSASVRRSGLVDDLASSLGSGCVGVFDGTRPHSPIEVVEAALERSLEADADAVISFGGGSCVDTAKGVVHLRRQLDADKPIPHVAIPTTLSGAEFTAGAGITYGAEKRVQRGPHMVAGLVILDPEATVITPNDLMLPSGLNALAHCVEGVCSPRGNGVSDATFLHAIRLIANALPVLKADPSNIAVRGRLLVGGSLAAMGIWGVPMGLEHALAHAIGGLYRPPHAKVHAVLIAPVMDFNRDFVLKEQADIADAFGVEGISDLRDKALAGADRVRQLLVDMELPTGLAQLGVPADDLTTAAQIAMRDHNFPTNPRPSTEGDVVAVLKSAL